jgi:hypothetical protein
MWFFFSISITLLSLPLLSRAENFSTEIAAVSKAILPFLSPLEPSFQKQIKGQELKKRVDQKYAKKIEALSTQDRSECSLTPREIQRLLLFKTPLVKNFRFTKTCDVNGSVDADEKKVYRVDLTLKNAGPYFRARYLMRYSATPVADGKRHRFEAKIYDGELYGAEDRNLPRVLFIADYAFSLDEKQRLETNSGGSLYLKKVGDKKIDRVFPLNLP